MTPTEHDVDGLIEQLSKLADLGEQGLYEVRDYVGTDYALLREAADALRSLSRYREALDLIATRLHLWSPEDGHMRTGLDYGISLCGHPDCLRARVLLSPAPTQEEPKSE